MKHITNERMDAFIATISSQVRTLLHERGDNMLAAWHENMEEAQSADEKASLPPLKLSISATVDLEKNSVESVLSFTVKRQSKIKADLPDPNQPELPMEGLKRALGPGDSMTVSVGGEEIAKFEKPKD